MTVERTKSTNPQTNAPSVKVPERASAIPSSFIKSSFASLGLLAGFIILWSLSSHPLLQSVAAGGTYYFAACTIIMNLYLVYLAHKNAKLQKEGKDQLVSTPPRAESSKSSNPVAMQTRLRETKKTDSQGKDYERGTDPTPPPAYYDLSEGDSAFLSTSKIGNTEYLKIPHIGNRPDDHYMAVCLPASQLKAFPELLRKDLEDGQDPELYFVVFKNHNKSTNYEHEILLHAMVNENTDLKIEMCETIGISDSTKVEVNHFKILQNADVSSGFIVASIEDGRKIGLHFLLLNNEEGGNGGAQILRAVQADSLYRFLRVINARESELDPAIQTQIANTLAAH